MIPVSKYDVNSIEHDAFQIQRVAIPTGSGDRGRPPSARSTASPIEFLTCFSLNFNLPLPNDGLRSIRLGALGSRVDLCIDSFLP